MLGAARQVFGGLRDLARADADIRRHLLHGTKGRLHSLHRGIEVATQLVVGTLEGLLDAVGEVTVCEPLQAGGE